MRIACVPSSPMRYIVSMRAIEPPADPAAKRPGETHAFSVVRGLCASSEAMLLTCCRSVSVCIGPCAFLGESDGFAFSASLTVLHAVLSGSSPDLPTPDTAIGTPCTLYPATRQRVTTIQPHKCILRIVAYLAVHKVFVSFASLLRPLSPLAPLPRTHAHTDSQNYSQPNGPGARVGGGVDVVPRPAHRASSGDLEAPRRGAMPFR